MKSVLFFSSVTGTIMEMNKDIVKKEYNAIQENGEALPYRLTRMETDSLYFKVFTPTVLTGNWEQVTHNRNSIVLTEHTAKKMYHEIHQAIGKQIILPNKQFTNGSVTYTVQAVIKDLPENTSMNFMRTVDLLKVNDDGGYEALPTPDITGYTTYALLNKNYSAKQLNEAFQQAEYTFQIFGGNMPICAKPLGEDFNNALIANMMAIVTALVGFLVLLAATLNFFHFQTGSFLNRGREFSIRKILGNNTSGLFWMQFIQITIVILAATLISGCLIELTSPFLGISLFRFSIQMTKEDLLPHLFQYMGGLLLLTAMVAFGISLYIRRATMRVSLHGLGNVNGKKRLRNMLLGVQFFICWLFVAMATGLYLQAEKTSSAMFSTLTKQEKEDILTVPLEYRFMNTENRRVLFNNIRQHAGIKDIMFADCQLISTRMTSMHDSINAERSRDVRIMGITPNFAKFLNINLEGKPQQHKGEIWIGRNFASDMKENAIGKTIYDYAMNPYTVCGVIDNITNYMYADGYGKSNYSNVYFLIDETEEGYYGYVKCYPGKSEEVKGWIEQKMREIFPSSVEVKTSTLQKDIEEYQALENNLKGIILCFSIVCLIITLLGVYSAITLDTEYRRKEVAIRKINGAGMKDIVVLFARLYTLMLVITALLAFPVVLWLEQKFGQMYTVSIDMGFGFFACVFLCIALVVCLTVGFRIYRTSRINPAEIIKKE